MNKLVLSFFASVFPVVSLAQDVTNSAAEGAPKAPGIESLIFQLFVIFMIFYLLLIKPQAKKAKMHQALVSSLKKGDKVVTQSGMFGTVSKAKEGDKTVEVEIAEGVSVTILRSAVQEIINLNDKVEGKNGKEKIKKEK